METLTARDAAARRRGTAPGLLVGLQAGFGIGLIVVTGLLLTSFVRVMQVAAARRRAARPGCGLRQRAAGAAWSNGVWPFPGASGFPNAPC